MKKEELYHAIGQIEDAYISKAHERSRKGIIPWIAVAACVILLVLTQVPVIEKPTVEETEATGVGISYLYNISDGGFETYFPGKVIGEEKIGNKIGSVTVQAGWWSHGDQAWNTQETLHADVYEITGVSSEKGIALKFLDKGEALTTTHYYVQLNPRADLAGLEEYIIPQWKPNNPADE